MRETWNRLLLLSEGINEYLFTFQGSVLASGLFSLVTTIPLCLTYVTINHREPWDQGTLWADCGLSKGLILITLVLESVFAGVWGEDTCIGFSSSFLVLHFMNLGQ